MHKAALGYYLIGLAHQIKYHQAIMYKHGFERGLNDEETIRTSQRIDVLVNQFEKAYHVLKYS